MPTRREFGQKDKRSKLDLELLLIALIEREINTPYLLHANVGLSPGATIPVLKRLNAARYIRRGSPGPRGRTEYAVTATGRLHLKSAWRGVLEGPIPTDMEAILRTACLATLCGAERKRAAAYLERAAKERALESNKEKRGGQPGVPDQAGLYPWMRSAHVKARHASEVQVLRQLASAMVNRKWNL